MTDDVKDALELARSSAASKCQCLDCRALRALIPHIDGEPARLAAAREEQREADAKFCPNCLGVGFVERPVPCPYCDDSTHDHYCPTGTQRQQCGCGAARIRATPLTATPLADEIAALRAQVEAARTYARQSLDYGEDCDAHDLLKAMDEAKP